MKFAKRLSTIVITTALAVGVGACSSSPTAKTAGEVVDDAMITAKVKAMLINDPVLKASEIQVETYKGDVQLSGFVANPADAAKAADMARTVKGVNSVKNDVRVK